MRVLVTRPEPDASSFALECKTAGFTPIVSPLMEIVFDQAVQIPDNVRALAFTSVNGVRAFTRMRRDRNMLVFAVGEATAGAARQAGFENVHVAGGDLSGLIELIGKTIAPGEEGLFHIAGTHRAGDLVNGLKALGIKATRAVLYGQIAAKQLPRAAVDALSKDPPCEWVTFFSPRTASIFFSLVQSAGLADTLQSVRGGCLSASIAEKLRDARFQSVEIAKTRDSAGMIAMLRA